MSVVSRFRPRRATLAWGALVVNTELIVVLGYFALSGPPETLGYLLLTLYPWVWLNASLWGLDRVSLPDVAGRRRAAGLAVAAGYFLVLAWFGGVLGPGFGDRAAGLRVVLTGIPPGFAPAVLYSGAAVSFNLVPFKLVGYATLAYLIYGTVLDTAESATAGLIGLLSCVSCSFPILASIASTLLGGSAAVAAISNRAYGLSTLVFVLTVVLLTWRPTTADLARLRAFVR